MSLLRLLALPVAALADVRDVMMGDPFPSNVERLLRMDQEERIIRAAVKEALALRESKGAR